MSQPGTGPLATPLVWASELLVVSHRAADVTGTGFPGYLFVETRRHAPTLDTLEPPEVGAVAQAVWQASRALRAELAPEFVFSAIVGRGVAHFHQHVFARHPGTPAHISWMDSHDWAGAPRVTAQEIDELCDRLGRHFR
ncbi:histidine triad (HIT) protein [Crossiella sp. SN42]|uniref:HIT family protein n=1 Tax=Crossiella sp. SN42 TaxID=2944808 RepID=UPI00207D6F70|nr:histidine triad (HIT) protein [Crossiella sp. SN42]MCO1574714.1 histidine triad (HIT) protein [Crossiella sp. SN42]